MRRRIWAGSPWAAGQAFFIWGVFASNLVARSPLASGARPKGVATALPAKTVDTNIDLSGWSLDEKLGQLFMVGYRSKEQLRAMKPGGVVLFSWNMRSVDGAKQTTRELKQWAAANLHAPLFVAIDHEGGQVLRLRKGLTNFPDAAAVGATRDPRLAERVGQAMGEELSALGINMNLAPVLDLGNARSFLQNRIWGDQGRTVGEMTTAFIRGLQSSRILPVAKHFPGHGRSLQDSHFSLPKLDVTEAQLWADDLEPFREATNKGVEAVMTAHVQIPVVDVLPASISKKFVTGILREKIGFKGLVVTDDLEMGGINSWGDAGDIALRALDAGSDMILVVWSQDSQAKALARLKLAVRSGEIKEEWLDAKVRRIVSLKRSFLANNPSELENENWKKSLRKKESLELADLISKKAVSWWGGDFASLMAGLSKGWEGAWNVFLPSKSAVTIWKRFRPQDRLEVLPRRPDDEAVQAFSRRLEKAIGGLAPCLVVTGPRASSSEEIFQAVRKGMARRLESRAGGSSVLWAHQGQRPVDIRRDPASLGIGIVSLHTSSVQGIASFAELLTEKAGRTRAGGKDGPLGR